MHVPTNNCVRESAHSGKRKKEGRRRLRKSQQKSQLCYGQGLNPGTLSSEPSTLTTQPWHPVKAPEIVLGLKEQYAVKYNIYENKIDHLQSTVFNYFELPCYGQ